MENIHTQKHPTVTEKRSFSPNTQKYKINSLKFSGNVLWNTLKEKLQERKY